MHRRIPMPAALAGGLIALTTMLAIAVGGTAKEAPLTLEVAETASRFIIDPSLVDADGLPTRGNTFVTEGYLYPAGTLTCSEGACDGVVYDAEGNPSPEFPDQVIGTWTCYGAFLEDAATTTTGPLVATTQIFDLGAEPGSDSVITNGIELADLGVPMGRAVIGGTGMYAGSSGVQTQTLMGVNSGDVVIDGVPLFGVSLSVELPVS